MTEAHRRLAILGVLSAMIAWAQPKPARQIAQQAFPSVVLVEMQDDRGQSTSLGSGFVLRDGLVVTNRHVIAGTAGGFVRLVDKTAKYEIAGTVAVDDAHDLAIIAATGLKAPSLPLGDSSLVAVGDEVYAVGNPQGLEGTFSQGIISAIRRSDGDTILQITAPISLGSSGGPILNGSGEAIGIAVATFTGGQNLNLAIPVSCLTALTGGISREVRPLSRLSSSGRLVAAPKGAPETLKDLMDRAQAGDAQAKVRIGRMYSTGNGVWANDEEAARWYRMAAEQGSAEAQYLLAGEYASGRGVSKDYAQALFWTSLAAVNSGPPPGVTAENAETLGWYTAGKLTPEQFAVVRSMLAKKAPQALDLPWFASQRPSGFHVH
jgi:hypothetical protein